MKTYLVLFLSLLTLLARPLQAEDVSFKMSGKTEVTKNENFVIQVSINAEGENYRNPQFEGLKLLSGPSTSSSSYFSNTNGRMTQGISITYTYTVRALEEGTFTVGPAKISIKGKEYKTNSLEINVSKTAPSSSQQNQANQSSNTTTQDGVTIKADDAYIKAFVDNKNPYLGEQIIISYKLYTKVPIRNIAYEEQPEFSGFWMKELTDPNKQLTEKREFINGSEYTTVVLRRIALIPQKTGVIKINPLEMSCSVQVRDNNRKRRRSNSVFDSFFDDPFFNGYKNIEHFMPSNTLSLNIKPLPQNAIPKGFNGAVGDFKLTTSIDKTALKTNDAITLKYTVSGQGNLELIEKPVINFPTDFEVYDPKTQDKIRKTNQGIIGSRTFEYLIIPRNPGEFELDTLTFSYFNPASKKYITQSTNAYTIQVEKGDDYQSAVTYSGVNQEDIQYIGQDIRHIKTSPEKLFKTAYYFYGSLNHILAYIIPIILFILTIIIWKKRIEKLSNQSLMRHKKATKVARKNLKKANQYLGTKESSAFYNEISQALWGYLADKFNIPLSELSNDSVTDALTAKGVKGNIITQFTDALNHCDYARFAPGDPTSNMDKIYNEALEIISKIERELK